MSLGNNLYQARKKTSLSQDDIAAKLGVSRQTISKWELDETIPDIYQTKKLASIFKITIDNLVEFNVELNEIEQFIEKSDLKKDQQIDWTKAWSKKYPILATYQEQVEIDEYADNIKIMLAKLQQDYQLSYLDAMLVLKDILAQVWKNNKKYSR